MHLWSLPIVIRCPESCKLPNASLVIQYVTELHPITILQLKWRSMVSQTLMIELVLLVTGFIRSRLGFEYGLVSASDLIVAQSGVDRTGLWSHSGAFRAWKCLFQGPGSPLKKKHKPDVFFLHGTMCGFVMFAERVCRFETPLSKVNLVIRMQPPQLQAIHDFWYSYYWINISTVNFHNFVEPYHGCADSHYPFPSFPLNAEFSRPPKSTS
jgi:hypothetical protein